jgi:hypothetical protein
LRSLRSPIASLAARFARRSLRSPLAPQVSEINLRENMGTLVLHLAQYVHPAKAGFYTILSRSFLKDLDGSDFSSVDEHELKVNEEGQITAGILRLTEGGEEFMAVLVVAATIEEAMDIAKVQGQEKAKEKPPAAKLSEVKTKRKFVWFSDRLKVATEGAKIIDFTPAVHAALAVEIEKVRAGREAARLIAYPPAIQEHLDSDAWRLLRRETKHSYDTTAHALRDRFVSTLGLGEIELDELHTLFSGDQGSKSDRREKTAMLAGLRDAGRRQAFLGAYENLVLEQLAPMVAAKMECGGRVVFQSFPCVRVLRPGEFSIGPHCDAQYQLPDGNFHGFVPHPQPPPPPPPHLLPPPRQVPPAYEAFAHQ